jgi:hypothetical protein
MTACFATLGSAAPASRRGAMPAARRVSCSATIAAGLPAQTRPTPAQRDAPKAQSTAHPLPAQTAAAVASDAAAAFYAAAKEEGSLMFTLDLDVMRSCNFEDMLTA